MNKNYRLWATAAAVLSTVVWMRSSPSVGYQECAEVSNTPFSVVVRAVGELEAAKSRCIGSPLRGDLGKVIELIKDGTSVRAGDLLVRLDPTPFEEKLADLKAKVMEQEGMIQAATSALLWEKAQSEREERQAMFEVESAEMELLKVKQGDGPLELSRLHAALQKALSKYEELKRYAEDLDELQARGFLNLAEAAQARKKLQEEKEAYETALLQYDTYQKYVLPMQIQKAESNERKAKVNLEETAKNTLFKVAKAEALIEQNQACLSYLQLQLKSAAEELRSTEIRAPSSGMAVLREDFRSGQRRKPRVGDHVVKNQPILDLPDLDSMVVKTRVREIDLHKIAIGKEAVVEVDAYPEMQLKGHVSSIGVLAVADGGRSSDEKFFEINVALNGSNKKLRPGMTARVTVLSDHIAESAVIPIQALFSDDKGSFCFVKKGRSIEKRPIHLGACSENFAQVIAGVGLGEKVYLVEPQSKDIHE